MPVSFVDKQARADAKQQHPSVIWLTGLSGAGKSTIAHALELELHRRGRHTFLIDGDDLRSGLSQDLGYTPADRVENMRRAGQVAKLMTDAGLIVIAALISPFRSERAAVKALFAQGEFVEVFVDVPLEVAEARDTKGFYRRARLGEIRNFTGITSAYECPHAPDVLLKTAEISVGQAVEEVLGFMRRCHLLAAHA